VDSEGLAGLLERAGHRYAGSVEEAECLVINTCSFIRPAEEESVGAILEAAELKRRGKLRRLYVAGCLPQKRKQEREDLLKMLPEVDGFLGPGDLPKLPELISRVISSEARNLVLQDEISRPGGLEMTANGRFFVTSPVPTLLFESTSPRRRLTARHFAYVKISEGCDHACTFCAIPQFRGPHRSRTIEDLVAEAERLASEGVVEVNLIGQDTSFYGADLYGRPRLPELLARLSRVAGIRWIRILYAHPAHVGEDLIRAIRELPPVVKYLDIPLQHVSDPLLAVMRRETDGAHIRRLVERLRQEIPGVAIRTTFIVGFPGETEDHVDELARFLQEAQFERVGIFPYSPEPKTRAERMPGQVPDELKKQRLDRLMRLQREISEEKNRAWLGRRVEVLVEEPETVRGEPVEPRTGPLALRHAQGERFYLGRTYADAPEVDGQVYLKAAPGVRAGSFVQARVTDTYEYDLVAELCSVAEVA